MSFLHSRFFRLFTHPANIAELTAQADDLRATVNSMAQDIRTLHGLLEQIWPSGPENYRAHYRAGRVRVMLDDSGGGGAEPFRRYSLYGYTLEPEEFLTEKLGATAGDIARCRREVEERQAYT